MRSLTTRAKSARRALVERLWAEGVDTKEIARRVGWSKKSPPSAYIASYRRKGWNLPPRMSVERVRTYREKRWGKR